MRRPRIPPARFSTASGSPLTRYALGVLVGASWEQQHYRTAADYARQTREALPGGGAGADLAGVRSRLNVVVAEAWYQGPGVTAAPPRPTLQPFPPAAGEVRPGRPHVPAGGGGNQGGRPSRTPKRPSWTSRRASPRSTQSNRWEAEWNLPQGPPARQTGPPGLRAGVRSWPRAGFLAGPVPRTSRPDGLAPGPPGRRCARRGEGLEARGRPFGALSGLDPALGRNRQQQPFLKAQTCFDLRREPRPWRS